MSGAEVAIIAQVASAAIGVVGGLQQASAEKKSMNAAIASQQQANLLQQRQADRQRRQILGSQTAALAAAGVDVNTGTSLDLYQDTAEQTLLDKAIGNFNNLSRQQEIWRQGQQRVDRAYGQAFSAGGNLLSSGAGGFDSWNGGGGGNIRRSDIRWNQDFFGN